MITYDDMMSFRRDSMDINKQVVAYTNKLIQSIGGSASPATPAVTLLDCHPELRVLEQKLDLLLSK